MSELTIGQLQKEYLRLVFDEKIDEDTPAMKLKRDEILARIRSEHLRS